MSCELKTILICFYSGKVFFNFAHPKQIFDTFRIKQSFYFLLMLITITILVLSAIFL